MDIYDVQTERVKIEYINNAELFREYQSEMDIRV